MSSSTQRIIPLEEGWNDEIKAKVSEQLLPEGNGSCHPSRYLTRRRVGTPTQAIDKLEKLLNGEMESGQTSMFGPREYVAIYT